MRNEINNRPELKFLSYQGSEEIPSCLIPRLIVVFTRQLEILVTTLLMQMYKPKAYMYKQQFTVFKIKEREKF